MLRIGGGGASRGLAWALLFWVLVPVALPITESVDSQLPPGVFDDADDDGIIAVLTNLDITLAAPIPPPPDHPWLAVGLVPAQADPSASSVAVVLAPARSPPLA